MTDQITTRQMQFDRGVAAFVRGATRDSHNMNLGAAALPDWLCGYDSAERSYLDAALSQVVVIVHEVPAP